MNRYRTLFDVLGVCDHPSDAEVQQAWGDRLAEAGGLDHIDADIEQAYRYLESEHRRSEYRELLRACQDGGALLVPSDNLQAFRQMCQKARVSVWPDPDVEDNYVVRLPGQEAPRWHERYEPIPPRTLWENIVHCFKSVFLFGAFRGKTLVQRVGLAFVYLIFGAAAVFGAKWLGPQIEQWRARALESAIRRGHSEAAAELEKVKAADAKLRSDFQSVTGAPLASDVSRPRPREVDSALAQHQSVREAWTDIVNGALAQAEVLKAERTLSEVGTHIQAARFERADKRRLQDLEGWIRQKFELLQVQRKNVEHIRARLEEDRFRESMSNPQKEKP